MWCLRSFNPHTVQSDIGVMTFKPPAENSGRTVLETTTVDASDEWWTGLVRDREHDTGEIRLRLERWVENDHVLQNPHTWRVRPDFWGDEREAVQQFKRFGGSSPPGMLPIDAHLTPREYDLIRKDDTRWVAVVRVESPYGGDKVRLYHWDASDGSVRQKWTVGRYWSKLANLATRHLQVTA